MNVAIFVSSFPTVSETFVLNHIVDLISRGHHVDIYADRRPKAVLSPDVKRLRLMDRTFYSPSNPKSMALRWLKIMLILGRHFLIRPLLALRLFHPRHRSAGTSNLLFRATTVLHRPKYDIIHAHFGPNGAIAAELKSLGLLSGPVVTTFHGYDLTSYVATRDDEVYARLFRFGTSMLPVSDLWAARLVALGCNPEKVTVHRMGIDLKRFTHRKRHLPVDQELVLLSVARLVEKKGLKYAIRAVGLLRKNGVQVRYAIVGDGVMRNELQGLVDELDLGASISLLGALSSDEVADQLDKAYILLAPSVTARSGDKEGIPVVIMEALACGLPVIATNHSGIPEIVEDGQTGLLVPERDAVSLANAVQHLVGSPELYNKISAAGRARVEVEYNNEVLGEELMDLYRSNI